MNAPAPVNHILIDESGTPRTANQAVKVKMIAQKYLVADETAHEIAAHYEIDLADVYAALAYYHDHRAYFEQAEATVEATRAELAERSADLRRTIQERLQAP